MHVQGKRYFQSLEGLVGSFTLFVRPYSLTISTSVLWFVVQMFSQLISARFRSPAIITDGGSLQSQ